VASARQWLEGARPRTLPAAIAPVLVGSGCAANADGFVWWKALIAMAVSLALQVGVNYANDYSDGIRGTDTVRVGPFRLVGSGAAPPSAVKKAAFTAFGVAAALGLILAATSGWWLVAVGAASIAAAWLYTGGPRPYGYAGLGEAFVFAFFGLVAVCATTYVQLGRLTWLSFVLAIAVGFLACAILVANNLRDIPTDATTGKRTLAVRLGDPASRWFYVGLLGSAFVIAALTGAIDGDARGALLALIAAPLAWRPVQTVRSGALGRDLIPVLRDTGRLQLGYAVALTIGLALR
jgi:1,4-dihydroxy-2-naphthoate octaprenyltransferase